MFCQEFWHIDEHVFISDKIAQPFISINWVYLRESIKKKKKKKGPIHIIIGSLALYFYLGIGLNSTENVNISKSDMHIHDIGRTVPT